MLPPPLSLFFLTYFIFIAAINPYFSLWLLHYGYSPSEMGVLLVIPALMRVFGPTFWGQLSDRTQSRVKWIQFMAIASVLGAAILGGVPYLIDVSGYMRFGLTALGLVLLHAMLSGQIPLAESLLLSTLGKQFAGYGRVRFYGSVGFLVTVLVFGSILEFFGIQTLFGFGVVMLLLHIFASRRLREQAVKVNKDPVKPLVLLELVCLPNVPTFLAASFLMIFGHMGLYIYFSLFLHEMGYSKTMIGVMWAVGVVGEIVYFRWQHRFVGSALNGYVRCYWVAVFRFAVLAWVAIPLGAPVWLLVLLQLLHLSTFGVHHAASMAYVRHLFPTNGASTANALFNTVTYGIAGALGATVCAVIWQSYGAKGVYSLSALSCALGGAFGWQLRKKVPAIAL